MGTKELKTPPSVKSMNIMEAFAMGKNKRKRKSVESEYDQQELKIPKISLEEPKAEMSALPKSLSDSTNGDKELPINQPALVCENTDNIEECSEKVGPYDVMDKSNPSDNSIIEVVLSDEDDVLNISSLSSSTLNTTNVSICSVNKDSDENGEISANSASPKDKEQNGCTPSTNAENLGKGQSNGMAPPKKKRKMSAVEAQQRTEMRLQKEKEKQLRKEEFLAKQEEKRHQKELREMERARLLRERQLKKELEEEEKKERERVRLEKKEQEDKERKQKLEEREKKIKLKEELMEAKAEQKRLKEQQRLKAIEDKKKFEEEKAKQEQEKELKKAKTKEAFQNFFLKSGFTMSPTQVSKKQVTFKPFQVAEDMTLAPTVPPPARERCEKETLDQLLKTQEPEMSYLQLLKSGNYVPLKFAPPKAKKCIPEEDVIIINNQQEANLHLKAKFLQFCENIRPAYWGTWRKKSKVIRARHPFGKVDFFDYDVDSDEEWDEGGPGESLTGTEDEESEDDYQVDEFLVPHGYLSAEEEGDEEENAVTADPEEVRQRLKVKEAEFLSARNKKKTALKPIILGCFFEADSLATDAPLEKSLQLYCVERLTNRIITPKLPTDDSKPLQNSNASNGKEQKPSANRGAKVPEEAIPRLIELLHGNTNSRELLVREFQEFWIQHVNKTIGSDADSKGSQRPLTPLNENSDSEQKDAKPPVSCKIIPKVHVGKAIQSIGSWGKSPDPTFNKFCWWVKEDILKKYGFIHLTVPNQWKYVSVRGKQANL